MVEAEKSPRKELLSILEGGCFEGLSSSGGSGCGGRGCLGHRGVQGEGVQLGQGRLPSLHAAEEGVVQRRLGRDPTSRVVREKQLEQQWGPLLTL